MIIAKYLKMPAAAFLLIAALILLVYGNTINSPFIWDDKFFIVENTLIRDIANITKVFTTNYFARENESLKGGSGYYRPFVTIFYMLDYYLWKDNAIGYHLTNIFLHILNTLLLFILIKALFGSQPAALLGALIYSVLPVHTNAVAYISGRTDLVTAFFYLLSLISFLSFARGKSSIYFAFSAVFFTCSLLSKESAAVLPLVILMLAFYDRKSIRFYASSAPYFLILLAYLIWRGYLSGSSGGSLLPRLPAVIATAGQYILLLLFPAKLTMERFISATLKFNDPAFLLSSLAIILSAYLIFLRYRNRYAALAWGWFFINLLPVINIIPVYPALKNLILFQGEQFLYIPSALFWAAVLYAASQKIGPRPLAAAACLIIALYSGRTIARNAEWSNPEKLYSGTIANSIFPYRAMGNLATIYYDRGELDRASSLLEKAIKIKSDYFEGYFNLGNIFVQKGNYQKAVQYYYKAIELNPVYYNAYTRLGFAFYKLNDLENALKSFLIAKEKDKTEDAYFMLGFCYYTMKDEPNALKVWQEGYALYPGSKRLENRIRQMRGFSEAS